MCLVLIAHRLHPRYPLILLSNRDEYFARPTQHPHVWPGESSIIAGKDQIAGGTWLGINKYGDWSALTNIDQNSHDIDSQKSKLKYSRGLLVRQFLEQDQRSLHYKSPRDFIQETLSSSHHYLPFNWLLSHREEIYYYSNVNQVIQELPEGLHGFSNGIIGDTWPKVASSLAQFKTSLLQNNIDYLSLLNILQDGSHYSKSMLSNGLPQERSHYPIFIKSKEYGTRQSTIIWIDRDKQMTFKSVSYDNLNRKTAHINLQLLEV